MKDIALKAGVSVTTVSHVISKTRHVAQETRELVLRTLDELDYQQADGRLGGGDGAGPHRGHYR